MRLQKVLAVYAVVMLAVSACTVEVTSDPTGTGGAGGTGGAAGSAGSSGAQGDAAVVDGATDAATDAPGAETTADVANPDTPGSDATADTATDGSRGDTTTADTTSDGGASDATADASIEGGMTDGGVADSPADTANGCFAEDGADSGVANTCAMLPYYATLCRDDGGLDWPPAGAALCDSLKTDLKVAAFQQLFSCLQSVPGADGGVDACSAIHESAVDDCSRAIFNRSTCTVPDGTGADGGVYGCNEIAASCSPDSGAGGIPAELCRAWLGPFNAATRQGIIDCYLDPTPVGATSCRDKFENHCVFPQ
ncbi:MAG: hypothetical protein ABW133_02635 [Polyangiaceae bacterium]